MNFPIPEEVRAVAEGLRSGGFEAYLVGGCVRDLILGRKPKDWDITTNAKPEDIQRLFPDSFYTNDFGTVGVLRETTDETVKVIEVTPYRTETGYSDKRRPDAVTFGDNLEEDLARRDFTINALAYDESKGQIIDPYKGQKDIEVRVLRTVGNPEERFEEDALRLMRAIRLVAELDFALDAETAAAIQAKAENLSHISKERIRDEFIRILSSKQPMMAFVLCQQLGILDHIAPDLSRGIGVDQNQAHSYDVFGHLMRALQHAADKEWGFDVRLAALFHDISKPETRRWSDEKKDWTFHGHEVVGARVTKKVLEELRFSRETIEKVTKLVRWHMFFSDPDQITLSAVRRMIRNVGEDNIWDLLSLRICDRIGTGRPKEQPFRFRKYKAMVEQALRDPISVGMLKTNGGRIMEVFHVEPGPRIGWTLNALLEEVLEDPNRNTEEYLDSRTKELLALSDTELKELGDAGKRKREEKEEEEVKRILDKHHVT
ncbi:MAG TPA: CCA tRNA nucleotidyltransferase [Candidatus Paceibacterota bacterium]|nr:CCA tRNA nucleotidyltransferase [Candidatus Paceibacterota bacterium]